MRLLPLLLLLALPLSARGENPPATAVSSSAGLPDEQSAETKETAQSRKLQETIVVTATRNERQVSEVPMSTAVVREEQIESAPASTVDDLLRTVPGVNMPLLGSGAHVPASSRISMRGLGGTRALVLLDGVPIHDPFRGTVQWQKVPVQSLMQVEVVRGGSAGLFGNYALGGTINLRTRPAEGNEVRLDSAWGNMDTSRAGIQVEHRVAPWLGLRLSHDQYDTDGFYAIVQRLPDDSPAWNNSAVTALRADFQAGAATSGYARATGSDVNVSRGTPLERTDRSMFDFAGGLHRQLGSRTLLSASVFHHDQDLEDFDTSNTAAGDAFVSEKDDIPIRATGASLEWSREGTGILGFWTFGADAQQTEAAQTTQVLSATGASEGVKFLGGRQRFAAFFAQASWRPATGLEVLTSARFDHYRSFDGRQTTVAGTTTAYAARSTTQFDPRISFRYSLGTRSALRGSAYRAFKAPTLLDLYQTEAGRRRNIVANPELDPEILVGAEVGYEWASGPAHLTVNVFRNQLENLATRVLIGPNTFQPQNLGRIRSQGIELSADLEIDSRWSLNAGYSWTDSIITEDPDPSLEGNRVPEAVPHIGSLSLRYRSGRGTRADLRGRILSSSYGEPANVVPNPAHHVVDLFLAHPVRPSVDVYVLAENVFDESYYYVSTTTDWRAARPRSVLAGIRARIPMSGR